MLKALKIFLFIHFCLGFLWSVFMSIVFLIGLILPKLCLYGVIPIGPDTLAIYKMAAAFLRFVIDNFNILPYIAIVLFISVVMLIKFLRTEDEDDFYYMF